ncbi:MAG: alpha/beta hydrolase [Candidatus Nanopelagicales bacterium]
MSTVTTTSTPATRTPAGRGSPHPAPWGRLWSQPAAGLLLAGLAAAALGVLHALVMPRGPVTAWHVVLGLVSGAVVGVLGGLVSGSRWALLVQPLAYVAAVEIARLPVVGPSVDAPRPGDMLGLIVLVTGRGTHALVVLLPLLVGAAIGAGWARRLRGTPVRPGRWHTVSRAVRRGVVAVLATGLALVGFALTRPGSTDPILGPDGAPLPGSVAELARVELGGHEQTVLLRGRSASAPVLLYLAGGPGQSDLGYVRSYLPDLEDHVVLAVWDQRGTGTSYDALDPTDTWTLEQAVADTVALSEYLADRFGQERIYLFGNSWGTLLGVLAVQARPDLFAAYVGAGQMVSPLETDRRINAAARDLAARTGDVALAEQVRSWGPPPYDDVYAYGALVTLYDRLEPYDRSDYFSSHRPGGIDGNGASEYGPLDKVNKLRALADMGAVMYPQVQTLDLRVVAPRLEVPVYLVAGTHELTARSDLAREWFDDLRAPAKRWVDFPESGHVPQFEEAPRFVRLIVDEVVPQTS